MYTNNFSTRENYCGNNCNSGYNEVKQLCTKNNMGEMLDQRSKFDQAMVPFYNQLALNTLTYPSLHADSMPELSPFAGYDINGQVAQPGYKFPKNEFGQYGASGLAPKTHHMRVVTKPPTTKPPYRVVTKPPYHLKSLQPPPGFRGCVPTGKCGAAWSDKGFCSAQTAAGPCNAQKRRRDGEQCCQWEGRQRENYGGSKLKDLNVDMFYSANCGHCAKLKKTLEKAGELENVNLKNVNKAEHSAEMKKLNLGAGVPALYSRTTKKKQIGNPGTVEALVAKLS